MKINEVEALVGITKKNIRFYEEAGLLLPRRDRNNGYRDYRDADVDTLRRIKLLRKLGFPLEEIRRMQSGSQTVGDGMRRHLITLRREQENLASAARLCEALTDCQERLDTLDAAALLAEMEAMERKGATFMDKQKLDAPRRYAAPIISAVVMVLLMLGAIWLMLWACEADPAGAPPRPVLALLLAIPAAVIAGVAAALILRIRELSRREAEDAREY